MTFRIKTNTGRVLARCKTAATAVQLFNEFAEFSVVDCPISIEEVKDAD
jgi:hypothetical protein